jgi:hypothetical protein
MLFFVVAKLLVWFASRPVAHFLQHRFTEDITFFLQTKRFIEVLSGLALVCY